METINNELMMWLQQLGVAEGSLLVVQRIVVIMGILLIAYLLDMICRKVVMPGVRKVTAKTQSTWDDYLLSDEVMTNVCHLIPPIVVFALIPFAFPNEPNFLSLILKICTIYITVVVMKLICAFLTSLYTISSEHEKLKNHSMKGFYQMLKLIVVCIGVIIIISELISKDPIAILTGLGAGTAILMLVFQDTIKGLVAGIQLTANDMVRPGDWISMPKYGADGDVMEVSLTTVKVRNWDNTLSMVPPYTLVSAPFKNWRGMQESGGRRADKMIYIDVNSLEECSQEMVDDMVKSFPLLKGKLQGAVMTDRLTNAQVYRTYIFAYLKMHPYVNPDLDIIVTQKEATPYGMPIEVYFFTREKDWALYEKQQSDIFDHLMSIAPEFGLRLYQRP